MINNKKICNNKLYEKCKEEDIIVTVNRRNFFGHILRISLNTPANESMKYYFKVPKKIKKYPGLPRTKI